MLKVMLGRLMALLAHIHSLSIMEYMFLLNTHHVLAMAVMKIQLLEHLLQTIRDTIYSRALEGDLLLCEDI